MEEMEKGWTIKRRNRKEVSKKPINGKTRLREAAYDISKWEQVFI